MVGVSPRHSSCGEMRRPLMEHMFLMALACHLDTPYSCIRVPPVSTLLDCDPHNFKTIQRIYRRAEVPIIRIGALGIVEGTKPVPEIPTPSRAAEFTTYPQMQNYRQARGKVI